MTKFDTYYMSIITELNIKRAWPAMALAGALATAGSPALAHEPPKKPAIEMPVARGVRNNNPGNIRITKDVWKGSNGHDGQFVKFIKPVYGIRAIAKLLRTYTVKYGLNTIEDIISKWAPKTENKTTDYIQRMSVITNIPEGEPLNLFDAKGTPDVPKLKQVIRGIMENEVGKAHKNYTDEEIEQAIGMI